VDESIDEVDEEGNFGYLSRGEERQFGGWRRQMGEESGSELNQMMKLRAGRYRQDGRGGGQQLCFDGQDGNLHGGN
jgi:hypothetical protein